MDQFFHPKSIAIIGFSLKEGNLGKNVYKNLADYGYTGRVWLVGRSGGEYQGQKIYCAVDELEESVDLAVIVTGAQTVPDTLEACGRKGIQCACIASGGFDEFTPGGSPLTDELRRIAEKYAIRFTGPNGFGVVNLPEGVFAPFGDMSPEWMRAGSVSVISQSGGLLYHIGTILTTGGMGVAKGVSMGNKVNLTEIDFLPYLLSDEDSDVVWLYLEGISDGRKLLEQARGSQKPILLLKSGCTQASQHALQSHTAAMASDDRVVSAMARQANILRAPDFRQMVEYSKILSGPRVRGNNLLVFTRSGGTAVMAVDEAEAHGFHLMEIPGWFADEFRRSSGVEVITPSNPVDLGAIYDTRIWLHLLKAGVECMKPDAVIFSYISAPGWSEGASPKLLHDVQELAHKLDIPLAVVVSTASSELAAIERNLSIPVFREVNDAVRSLAAARDWYTRSQALSNRPFCATIPAKPDIPPGPSPLLPKALQMIENAGIRVPAWAEASSEEEAVMISRLLGYPLVLKVISREISHKTDLGGVILNISDDRSLRAAWQLIHQRIAERAPEVRLEKLLLQKMVSGGREMILGGKNDPGFGPVILLGMGGIYAEVFNDSTLRIAPLDDYDIDEMLGELRCSRLLRGVRGEKPLDVDALRQTIKAVSTLLLKHPEIKELDINPLLVKEDGVWALDARIIHEA